MLTNFKLLQGKQIAFASFQKSCPDKRYSVDLCPPWEILFLVARASGSSPVLLCCRLHHMWQGVVDRFGAEVFRIESEAKKFLDESFRALRYGIRQCKSPVPALCNSCLHSQGYVTSARMLFRGVHTQSNTDHASINAIPLLVKLSVYLVCMYVFSTADVLHASTYFFGTELSQATEFKMYFE